MKKMACRFYVHLKNKKDELTNINNRFLTASVSYMNDGAPTKCNIN